MALHLLPPRQALLTTATTFFHQQPWLLSQSPVFSYSSINDTPAENPSSSQPSTPTVAGRPPPSWARARVTKAQYTSSGKMLTMGSFRNLSWWHDSMAMDRGLYEQLRTHPSFRPSKLDLARLLRRLNFSLPALRKQLVLAKVLSVDAENVYVDPEFYGVSEIPRATVNIGNLHTQDGVLPERQSVDDIRPGDLLQLQVESEYTPYGDMQLQAVERDPEQHKQQIWQALKELRERDQPVHGRLLNSCSGGYAVGIAGFVAFLPLVRATLETSYKIGMLEPFYLQTLDDSRFRITVSDARKKLM